ncbi:unnamed protein product [Closterium sp. NIES-54]
MSFAQCVCTLTEVGEFSSDLLRDFCRGEGILQSFTLPVSPQQNEVAERRIGLVMEVARTPMIHVGAPHFLWPFAVRYAALSLWPRVSLLETSPTLRWTGKVGDASVFRAQPVEVSVDSCAARGAACEGAACEGAEPASAELGGAEFEGAESGGAEPEGAEPGGAESEGAESGGAEPRGIVSAGGPAGASPRLSHRQEPLSLQQLHEWFSQRTRLRSGAEGAGGPAAGDIGAGGPGGARAAGPGGARTRGTGAAGAGGVGDPGAGAGGAGGGGPGAGGAGTGGAGAGGTKAKDPGAGGAGARDPGAGGAGAGGAGASAMLLAPEGDPDVPDIPTPRSHAEAITGPYSSQWQTAMDAEMASWKSTGTYVDAVPPPGAKIVDGMWTFRVKRPSGSPPVFKARYAARGSSQRQGVDFFKTFSPTPKMTTLRVPLHVAAQRDYELHSLDFSTAFLQGSLHKEIWLRRPPGFTGLFPAGTQWSLQWPVYGLRQAPREWHDTLRTTLAALGFAPSTSDPSLFERTDTSLPLFYILVYVDDLVLATADTEALALVKSELQKRHTCTDMGELRSYLGLQITPDRARRTITLTESHMVHQVLQHFGFRYSSPQSTPLPTSHSLSAPSSDESVEPSGPTSGMGFVLGGRGLVFLTRHANASWVVDLATQQSSQGYTFSLGSGSVSWRSTRSSSVLSSSCEDEIYTGAMAAQKLRWLTYVVTDLGGRPRSPPNPNVDNKAMIALCQEHRLEHRTKHIALRYFLARELQHRGQLRLAYVAIRAKTADISIKALQPAAEGRGSQDRAAAAGTDYHRNHSSVQLRDQLHHCPCRLRHLHRLRHPRLRHRLHRLHYCCRHLHHHHHHYHPHSPHCLHHLRHRPCHPNERPCPPCPCQGDGPH